MNKYLLGLLALCLPFVASAQTFLGKRLVVDANISTSSKAIRLFDVNDQFLWEKSEYDYFDIYGSDSHYLDDDGSLKVIKYPNILNCNIHFSADVEAILWKKGSVIVEARMNPYTDFYFKGNSVVKTNEYTLRKAQERSFEAGIGYRQYMFNSSRAPYGRYVQVGLNKVQVQWMKSCTNIENLESVNSEYSNYIRSREEIAPYFINEQKSGNVDLWAAYLELGYNHLFFNNRLRLSFSMRTEVPFGYDAYETVYPDADYYAVRHFWSSNFFSLKAGVGYVIF